MVPKLHRVLARDGFVSLYQPIVSGNVGQEQVLIDLGDGSGSVIAGGAVDRVPVRGHAA